MHERVLCPRVVDIGQLPSLADARIHQHCERPVMVLKQQACIQGIAETTGTKTLCGKYISDVVRQREVTWRLGHSDSARLMVLSSARVSKVARCSLSLHL